MRKPKKRLVRTLSWVNASNPYSWRAKGPTARFWLFNKRRYLPGPVGQELLAMCDAGKIIFLDKTPRQSLNHILVVGIYGGLLVVYHDFASEAAVAEQVDMCDSYRDRIVGGFGKIRWARVKAVAARKTGEVDD